MSWEDRDYAQDPWRKLGRPGGDWKGLRPTFDNPMTWSLPFMRLSGVTVRIHIIFLLFIVVRLVQALAAMDKSVDVDLAFRLAVLWMGCTFLMVLLHEFGHVLACRLVGGTANEILMWPLGGLAYCAPPNTWRAHLVTVLGGPAVNVIFLLLITPMIGAAFGKWWGVAIGNPFSMDFLLEWRITRSWVWLSLCVLNWVNLILLLFNTLPMFPLDGGRVLQALLWPRFGYTRSMRIAVRVGYLGAIGLGLMGFIMRDGTLIGIALFGGVTCYITHKQMEHTDQTMGFEDDQYAMSLSQSYADEDEHPKRIPAKPSRAERRAALDAKRIEDEVREVDRILQKIASSGLGSLTRSERQLLERETERKRQQG